MMRHGSSLATGLTATVAAAFFFFPAAGVAQEMKSLGKASQIVRYDGPTLTSRQQSKLDEFQRKSSYFNSFAVSGSTGRYGRSGEYHTQRASEIAAKAYCAGKNEANDCVVIATVLPASLPASSQNAVGIRWSVQRYVRDKLPGIMRRAAKSHHHAIAAGPSNWATANFESSPQRAERRSLAKCNGDYNQDSRADRKRVRAALERAGIGRCKVVLVTSRSNP